MAATLEATLDARSRPGTLWYPEPEGAVRCTACGHRCLVRPGRRGICKVRSNRDGILYVPAGYAAGIQSDPIEKKPFFHVLPGTDCLTFGMLGCDFHCGYCQNWVTSQALRDPDAGAAIQPVTAAGLVELARTRVALASALAAQRLDRTRVVRLAQAARDVLAGAGAPSSSRLARAEALLRKP